MKQLFLTLALLLAPVLAVAADGQCTSANVGAVQCMAQKMCECKFFRKSEMASTPDRFSWDCGILRPNCSDTSVNAPNNTPAYDGPSSVGYGRSNTNIVQSPTTTNTQGQVQAPVINQEQQSPTTTNTSTTTQNPSQNSTQNQ